LRRRKRRLLELLSEEAEFLSVTSLMASAQISFEGFLMQASIFTQQSFKVTS